MSIRRKRSTMRETADYDYGHNDPSDQHSFKIDSFDFKGRADMKVRSVPARYTDNPMYDYSKLNEDGGDESMLELLHSMLTKANITDDEIRNGVSLTDKGLQKAAARLGCSPDEVVMLLNSLKARLDDDTEKNLTAAYEAAMEGLDHPFVRAVRCLKRTAR